MTSRLQFMCLCGCRLQAAIMVVRNAREACVSTTESGLGTAQVAKVVSFLVATATIWAKRRNILSNSLVASAAAASSTLPLLRPPKSSVNHAHAPTSLASALLLRGSLVLHLPSMSSSASSPTLAVSSTAQISQSPRTNLLHNTPITLHREAKHGAGSGHL